MKQAIIVWVLLMSLITFVVYGIDKHCSKHDKWRIKENTLLLLGLIGGAFGAFLGMKIFHHKTLKKQFRLFVPLECVLWIVVIVVVLVRY